MISSFKCKDTQELYETGDNRRFAPFARVALRKLDMLEQLRGNRKGQWSIRVNDQWRICFRWIGTNACDVEIVDYH